MLYTKDQRDKAYKKLSEEAQSFVTSNETTGLISKHIKEAKLSGEQAEQADSEFWYALLNLQTLDESLKNIAHLTQKSVESLNSIKAGLNKDVFSKLEEIKKAPTIEGEARPTLPSITSGLPMVEEGEIAHDVPRQENFQPPITSPQPVGPTQTLDANSKPSASEEPVQTKEKPKPDYKSHYPTGQDPYREPI